MAVKSVRLLVGRRREGTFVRVDERRKFGRRIARRPERERLPAGCEARHAGVGGRLEVEKSGNVPKVDTVDAHVTRVLKLTNHCLNKSEDKFSIFLTLSPNENFP